jgi:SnoaL-like domain
MSSSLDLKAITEKFFAAYDGHDVDGMLALCADGAQGRYLPYGKKSDMPIRGGLEQIWRGLLGAVPDFGVEVVEMIQGEGNIVVVQALLGGAMPADVPGLVIKGKSDRIAHAYIIRYSAEAKSCAWIVIGTTPPSTPLRRAFCERKRRRPVEKMRRTASRR